MCTREPIHLTDVHFLSGATSQGKAGFATDLVFLCFAHLAVQHDARQVEQTYYMLCNLLQSRHHQRQALFMQNACRTSRFLRTQQLCYLDPRRHRLHSSIIIIQHQTFAMSHLLHYINRTRLHTYAIMAAHNWSCYGGLHETSDD